MKRVEIEKAAILRALDASPNITAASRQLGASRRTLQTRMRDHGLPPGESGRPRHLLSYGGGRHLSSTLTNVILVGGALGLGYWLLKREQPATVVGGGSQSPCCAGLDAILRR